MLNFWGRSKQFCDGVSRRSFLKVGTLGLGGLSMSELFARQARGEVAPERKGSAVIFIELAGGPTHFETYDPKPNAPAEYRGPLGTVATKLPGVYLSEFMVEQAKVMDRLAIIRSVQHNSGSHGTSSHLTQTGYYLRDPQNRQNEMPCIGSIVSRLQGANQPGIPAFVSMPAAMRYGTASFLGKGYNPFIVDGDPNQKNFQVKNLSLEKGLSDERLEDRRALLASFDRSRRMADIEGVSEAMDQFTRQAFELVTSDRSRAAFDLKKETDKTRDEYGRNSTGQSILLARRLVEAGVSFVTVRVSGWDDHSKIAQAMKKKGPDYDRAVAALTRDLYGRGLDQQVLVLAMGEFGRTPRVNKNAGRDHWGSAMSVMMTGGGLRVGQVVGATNAKGEVPQDNPYRPENILATVYQHMGINPENTFADLSGRPRYILENRGLISELV